tara:strand:+ start:985 stop:1323 length:339 start_codon:yes stop_codon:yes gene_type:complete
MSLGLLYVRWRGLREGEKVGVNVRPGNLLAVGSGITCPGQSPDEDSAPFLEIFYLSWTNLVSSLEDDSVRAGVDLDVEVAFGSGYLSNYPMNADVFSAGYFAASHVSLLWNG